MSLIDALLLDAAPFEVWVALRTEGAQGSGTQSDPYDGSTIAHPSISVTSLQKAGTGGAAKKTANATTSVAHGFSEGEWITISGVSTDTDHGNAFYMGTFQVHPDATYSNKFTYTMDSEPPADAAGGSIVCCRERERLDAVLRALPENATVRLGPGVFETKGSNGYIVAWKPKRGQKISGAGIGITTVKLVRAEMAEANYFAIYVGASDWVPDFEVSELTIDCNIAGQPEQHVTCGAVYAPGRHNRIRRIRVINFGCQTRAYIENFVVMSGATDPNLDEQGMCGEDCIIEDCIAEWPTANPTHNSTMFNLGGTERPYDGVMAFHRGCAIRNCYANGQVNYGPVVPIDSISYDGTAVTVTTKAPHGRTMPGNVLVQGVTVGDSYSNRFNGLFAMAQVVSSTVLKYNLNTTQTPDAQSGTVGGGVSSIVNPIDKVEYDDEAEVCDTLALDSFQKYEYVVKLTTRYPHYRTTNNRVSIGGLSPSAAFNGNFPVSDYDPIAPRELRYLLESSPDAEPGTLGKSAACINPAHQALSADNGIGTVVEGNRVFHCTLGGPYHDSWSTRDLVVRSNYYHDVLEGTFQSGPFGPAGGVSATTVPIPLASLNNDGNTATAHTAFPHGFSALDSVTISGASEDKYNGTYPITQVPAANQFQYTLTKGTPSGPAVGAAYSTAELNLGLGPQRRLASVSHLTRNGRHFARAKTTYAKHGFAVGDWVRVTMAGHFNKVQYPNSGLYNGVFRISDLPVDDEPSKTFEFELSGDPGVDSISGGADFASGYFGRVFQVKNLMIENNVIELAICDSEWYQACGVRLYAQTTAVLPAFPLAKAVIRNNVIGNVNGALIYTTRGIELHGCEEAIVENNVIQDVPRSTPIEHSTPAGLQTGVRTFNNAEPNGTLLYSYSSVGKAPEVTDEVWDAVLLGLGDF